MPLGTSPITTAGLGELLKTIYAPWEIQQLVNLTVPVLAMCATRGNASLGGTSFNFPVRTESANGFAYITESQVLPKTGSTEVLQASVVPTVFAGVVEITGLSQAVAAQDVGAFARSFDENMTQTVESMSSYKEGVLFGDGSGLLGTITSIAGAPTYVLDDVSLFRIGMSVDVNDATSTADWLARETVTDIDWINRTITLSGTISGGAVNDTFFISGGHVDSDTAPTTGLGAPSSTLEPIGFQSAFSKTNTYLGIDRTQKGNWRSNTFDSSNSFFVEDILLRARTQVTQESGVNLQTQSSRFKVVTHPNQVDSLFRLAIPRIRYSGNETFDLGNSDEVKFGNIPFVTSHNARADQAYMGDWSKFQSFYTPGGELHVDTEKNGSALKWVANRDVGVAYLVEYCAFACVQPNVFVRVFDLDETARGDFS